MIERLNFFDLYGYLIPGLALVAISLAPLVVIGEMSPSIGIGGALAWIVAGYVVGLLLHAVARDLIPAWELRNGSAVYDSVLALDLTEQRLSLATLARLQDAIREAFGLEIEGEGAADVIGARKDAFFRCRSWLLQRKLAGYAEQFEGMYSMLRSLSAASYLGSANAIGFSLGAIVIGRGNNPTLTPIAFWVLAGLLLGLCGNVFVKHEGMRHPRFGAFVKGMWLAAAALAGVMIGTRFSISDSEGAALLVFGVCSALSAIIFHKQFRYFNRHFSETVYRDFLESYSNPPMH